MKNKILLFLGLILCFAGPPTYAQQVELKNIETFTSNAGVGLSFTAVPDTGVSYIWYTKVEGQPGVTAANSYEIPGKEGRWLVSAWWFNNTGQNVYCDGRPGGVMPVNCLVGWNISLFYDGRIQTGCIAMFTKSGYEQPCGMNFFASSQEFAFKAPTVTGTATTSTSSTVTSSSGTSSTSSTSQTKFKGKGNGGGR